MIFGKVMSAYYHISASRVNEQYMVKSRKTPAPWLVFVALNVDAPLLLDILLLGLGPISIPATVMVSSPSLLLCSILDVLLYCLLEQLYLFRAPCSSLPQERN